MSPQLGRSVELVAATVLVFGLSTALAAAAAWPLRGGPPGVRALTFLMVFAVGALVGVPATGPWLRRGERRRARRARRC